MDILNYEELPEKIKGFFKSKIESELIQSHKDMGLDKPEKWQLEDRLEYESKKYLFHNYKGNYYFSKLEQLGYFNNG